MSDILVQAEKAARDYKAVCGKWPEHIGVRSDYPGSVPPSVIVMELHPPSLPSAVKEYPDTALELAPYIRHCIPLEPVWGPALKQDELYLPSPARAHRPGSEYKVIGSKLLAKMAKEFEP